MSNLSDHNIYRISLEQELGRPDLQLIYSPLADAMTLASTAEAEEIERAFGGSDDPDEKELVESLTGNVPANGSSTKVNNVDEFVMMYVLPNYICNFSCSYCFSAKGRSKGQLKKEHLKAALDYFVDSKRTSSKKLAITYLGGGEPTLSWDLVKYGLEYADELSKPQDIEMMTTVVTNGSRITQDIVDTFSKYNVMTRVSFEILEDIQNLQRGQYDNVNTGLNLLAACKRAPMVRSMITPDNVYRLSEMIEALHTKWPHVKNVLFDPIISAEIFSDVSFTKDFYDKYYDNFLKARRLGATYGIDVSCAPIRNLDMIVERFCTGEFCLTPEGTITLCHQISSPLERDYTACIYAHIDSDNKLVIDNDKFKRLTSSYTIYTNPACVDCFIKWNCGGGCMMQNKQYTDQIREIICNFTRRFSLTLLVDRLRAQFEDEGINLNEYINDTYGPTPHNEKP